MVTLQGVNLKAEFTYKASPEPKDTVLSFSPEKGTMLAEGSVVTVVLSAGDLVLVRDVVDTTEAKARELLQKDGLVVQTELRQLKPDEKGTPGNVIAVRPSVNTPVKRGSTVVIVVAEAPVTPSSPPPATTAPPSTPPPSSPPP
jgi:serine/threonine-protein kinase